MNQVFKGKLVSFEEPRAGETEKGVWASVSFILREFNPANPAYPQLVKMDMFKNGENMKYAKDFGEYYKVGDVVEASYNFAVQDYEKDGVTKTFGKVSCWKLQKVDETAKTETLQNQGISQEAALGENSALPF